MLSLALPACSGASAVDAAPSPVAQPTPSASAAVASAEPRALTPREIAAKATPSVVTIRGTDSLGSGFVVKKEGWIATNLHVLAPGDKLTVVTAGGLELPVIEVLAVDDDHDLALVRVDAKDLPVLEVADSDLVRPGDPVVAIGHPLGFEDTVSDGLVSAVREVSPELTVLQISAPIAPGSSGGPLIDAHGGVIGVATLVARDGQNLNFGMPTRYLRALMSHVEPVEWGAFVAAHRGPALPVPVRAIPHHEVSMLGGCGQGDLELVAHMIDDAISVGAPLYNKGAFAACYHVYSGASADLEPKLGAACVGPKRALAEGRRRAAKLSDPSAQAWAMRDSFDGLLDVIVRKLKPKP